MGHDYIQQQYNLLVVEFCVLFNAAYLCAERVDWTAFINIKLEVLNLYILAINSRILN